MLVARIKNSRSYRSASNGDVVIFKDSKMGYGYREHYINLLTQEDLNSYSKEYSLKKLDVIEFRLIFNGLVPLTLKQAREFTSVSNKFNNWLDYFYEETGV